MNNLLPKFGADTAENEPDFAKQLDKAWTKLGHIWPVRETD